MILGETHRHRRRILTLSGEESSGWRWDTKHPDAGVICASSRAGKTAQSAANIRDRNDVGLMMKVEKTGSLGTMGSMLARQRKAVAWEP